MNCPTCHAQLTLAERQGIEIDYCPSCRGVWLDRGELDKIIERSAQVQVQPRAEPWRPDDRYERHDDRKPYKKKREGFLGELFDF